MEDRDPYAELLRVIKEVHSQHADDLCWMPADVNKIFIAAGLPPQDLHVGSKEAMLANCSRYVECLQEGGPWLSYAELEAQNEILRARIRHLELQLEKQPEKSSTPNRALYLKGKEGIVGASEDDAAQSGEIGPNSTGPLPGLSLPSG